MCVCVFARACASVGCIFFSSGTNILMTMSMANPYNYLENTKHIMMAMPSILKHDTKILVTNRFATKAPSGPLSLDHRVENSTESLGRQFLLQHLF